MPGFGDLALAYLLSSGAHTGGHFVEAQNQDVPIGLNIGQLAEKWNTPDKEKASLIHGAGYKYQDLLGKATEGTRIGKEINLANGLYKLAYLAGLPNILSSTIRNRGDIGGMEETSGNKYVAPMLGLSALGDIYRHYNPDTRWSLDFIQGQRGTPGLGFSTRW